MPNWAEIISEAYPGKQWTLQDSYNLDTLHLVKNGELVLASKAEKRAIEAKAEEVLAILEARRARRAKMKAVIGDLSHGQLYEILLDDEKLDRLKTRVREIEGG